MAPRGEEHAPEFGARSLMEHGLIETGMSAVGNRGVRPEYRPHFNASDELSASQRHHNETQLAQFKRWYADWSATVN